MRTCLRFERTGRPLTVVAIVLLGLVIGAHATATASNLKVPAVPNVLFIVTDDQDFGTVGCCDQSGLDWMLKTKQWLRQVPPLPSTGGVLFQNAVVTTPLCCPSRSSIFTGMYAHNHGVEGNDPTLLDPTKTLQYYLQTKAGYLTGMFGKYLNNWNLFNGPPNFDLWTIYNNGPHSHFRPVGDTTTCDPTGSDWPNQGLDCINKKTKLTDKPSTTSAPVRQYETHYLFEQIQSFLAQADRNDSRPWFLDVAPTLPHPPLQDDMASEPGKYDRATHPEPYVPTFTPSENYMENDPVDGIGDKPAYVQANACPSTDPPDSPCRVAKNNVYRTDREIQFRMLKSVDDFVDDIFKELTARNEVNDTLVFYISDNGYLWGDHWLRGKPLPYMQDIRVPMFMRWPARSQGTPFTDPSSRNDSRIVANVDLAPTVMNAVGISPDKPMDGKDLYGSTQRDRSLTESWATGNGAPTWAGTMTPRPPPGDTWTPYYHYIENYLPDGTVFHEYYNLRTDFNEDHNLYGGDGQWQGGDDLAGAPDPQPLSAKLAADRSCAGQTPPVFPIDPTPCP
jgi:arylsulfatase A-like enzyme